MIGIVLFSSIAVVALLIQFASFSVVGRVLKLQELRSTKLLQIIVLMVALNAALFFTPLAVSILGIALFFVIPKMILKISFKRAAMLVILASVLNFILGLAVSLPMRLWVLTPFRIPSGAMEPSLKDGDRFLVNRIAYHLHKPQRWDVAIFRFPSDPRRLMVKRVIGLPGETIQLREGRVWINGASETPLKHLAETKWLAAGQYAMDQPYQIPEDCYFVVGDNAASSHDSRFWGCVPSNNIIGKAFYVFSPRNRMGEIH